MNIVGFGRILVWQGGSLWIGQSVRVQPHTHHGIQIGIALEGEMEFDTKGEWRPYAVAVIPSKLRHAMDTRGKLAAQIFVEPESVEGRILAESHCAEGMIASLPLEMISESAARLLSDYLSSAADDQLVGDAHAIIGDLTAGTQPRIAIDPRIRTAIDLMRTKLDMTITLRHAASLVHLSPGRFRHLFVEQTGTPLRPYLLWLRIATAVESIARGESITEAAHLAGFSDSAHLARIFRRTFGMAPSALRFDKGPARKLAMEFPADVRMKDKG